MKSRWSRREFLKSSAAPAAQALLERALNPQAAMNFSPISESAKQKLQEKVAPSRSAWENFLRSHRDSMTG